MDCREHGKFSIEFDGNIGSPPEGYCYQCEIDKLRLEVARLNARMNSIIIRDRDGKLITQGAFNALESRYYEYLEKMKELDDIKGNIIPDLQLDAEAGRFYKKERDEFKAMYEHLKGHDGWEHNRYRDLENLYNHLMRWAIEAREAMEVNIHIKDPVRLKMGFCALRDAIKNCEKEFPNIGEYDK